MDDLKDRVALVTGASRGIGAATAVALAHAGCNVAIGYNNLNQTRMIKYHEAKEKGYTLVTYVCSKSVIWDNAVEIAALGGEEVPLPKRENRAVIALLRHLPSAFTTPCHG